MAYTAKQYAAQNRIMDKIRPYCDQPQAVWPTGASKKKRSGRCS